MSLSGSNMASGKIPSGALSLKRFMLRNEVIKLYRQIFKALREVPENEQREQMKDWAREEFKLRKDETQEEVIRMRIAQGKLQLKKLESMIDLAK